MTESVGNNENLNNFCATVRLSGLAVLTGKFEIYPPKVHFCNSLFIKMVFTLEHDIFIRMAYFRIKIYDVSNGCIQPISGHVPSRYNLIFLNVVLS
jgi:hypothetical protein